MRKPLMVVYFVLLLHLVSYAGQITTVEMNRVGNSGDSLSKSEHLLSILQEEEDRINAWDLNIGGSFVGDKADDKTAADVSIAASITKGIFPRQFRFNFESSIQLENGKLDDDVTALILNYDYYINRRVEVYSFIERFSDSYMDINQRFEIGFGMKMQGEFCGLVDKTDVDKIEGLYASLPSAEKEGLKDLKRTVFDLYEET